MPPGAVGSMPWSVRGVCWGMRRPSWGRQGWVKRPAPGRDKGVMSSSVTCEEVTQE
ncbi:hypothetical protein GCM10027586_03880 [Kineococcus gypseus]